MRVMTGDTILTRDRTELTFPVAAGPAVDARLPVPIGRAVAIGAKQSAFGDLQLAPIPCL